MKTSLSKKQLFAILAIIGAGILLGALILGMGPRNAAGDDHGEHAEHRDASHKDEGNQAHAGEEKHDDHGHADNHRDEGGKAAPAAAGKPDEHGHGDGHEDEEDKKPQIAAAKPDEHGHADEAEQTIALANTQIKAAGIAIQTAGPARIDNTFTLPGEIHYNQDRTAHVVPRVPGVVEKVAADLGQTVKKGQVLAVLASTDLSEQRSELLSAQKRFALAKTTFEREKKLWQEKISAEQDYLQAQQAMQEAEIAVRNARQKLSALGAAATGSGSLNTYEIRAPFAGMVMEKHLSLGEALKEDADIFTISDLSTVWAEIAVPAKDLNAVRVGEMAIVRATAFNAEATGKVTYVGSLLGEQTRTAKARVVLDNPDMAWRPGLFVNVQLVSQKSEAPVTVATNAIHTVEDKPTIFVRVPGGFRPQHITPGRSNGNVMEVIKGLEAGTQYAAAGSFLVKSELGKASAEHVH